MFTRSSRVLSRGREKASYCQRPNYQYRTNNPRKWTASPATNLQYGRITMPSRRVIKTCRDPIWR